MTKKDLVKSVINNTDLNRNEASALVECFLSVFIEKLAQEKRIEIRNFGVFKVKRTPARVGRNPKTKEETMIPAMNIVQFRPGKIMKLLLNPELAD